MMMIKIFLAKYFSFKGFLFATVLFIILVSPVAEAIAQATPTPAPTVSPAPIPVNTVTLSSMVEELIGNMITFRNAFMNIVEGTLGGYFSILAYILAWIIAVYYFIQQFIQGEWDASQVGRFTGRIVICLLLLIFCGDVDGDGRRGDIVRYFGYFGYHLSYGESPSEPSGNFISRTVKEQKTKFNQNYDAFVKNKLMLKINESEMPIKYPGMQGIQTVAAVYIGQATPEQEAQVASQAFWIGLEFQLLNICRSIIEILDFFLLVLYSFGILVLILIAPFMMGVMVNRDLAKRFTYPFFWTSLTIAVIFPLISQIARYFAYLIGNLALGTSGNPIYTFDATTNSIVANGDPMPMILVAVICMLISILFLAMSVVLSFSLVQGRLVESMSGLVANTFAAVSSIGLGALVSGYATRLSSEAETTQILANEQSTLLTAGANLQGQMEQLDASRRAQYLSAYGNEQAALVGAYGDAEAKNISDLGTLLLGQRQAGIQQYQSNAQAYTNAATQIATMNVEERESLARKSLETYFEANRITDEADKQRIVDTVAGLNLEGDKYNNYIESLGPVGSVARQFFNGQTYEAWVKGRALTNTNANFDPNVVIPLSNGTQFSLNSFLQQGVMPNIQLQQPTQPNLPTMQMNPSTMQIPQPTEVIPQPTQDGVVPNGIIVPTNGANVVSTKTLTPIEGSTGGTIAVPTRNGDTMWSADTMTKFATNSGFNNVVRQNDYQIAVSTEGKTAEQIAQLQQNAQTVGIQSRLNGNQLTLWDTPPQQIPAALQTTTQTLPRVGMPNIPTTLYNPLNTSTSSRAAKVAITNADEFYYNPAQEAQFVSTGNKQYDAWIIGAARTHGINPNLLRAQFYQESKFKNGAVSPKGAGGIAQIMPGTAPRLGVTDRFNPAQSIYGGAKYMRYIGDFMVTQGGVRDGRAIRSLALAGYNSGEGRVQKSGFTIPRIQETQDYVGRISTNLDNLNQLSPKPNANRYITDLRYYSRPEAEYRSKVYANNFGEETALRRNFLNGTMQNQITRATYAQKRQITAANLNMQYSINNNVAEMTNQSLQEKYYNDRAATLTTLNSRINQAAITRDTSIQAADINYFGGTKQAMTVFQGQRAAAELTRQASLSALYKRNMASLVQSVGGSISHQISELFERASRGM